jgi:hypothetical protein
LNFFSFIEFFNSPADTHVWRRLDTAGREPQSRTSHAMALDEENGLIYLIAGSGPEFGFTNMNDIHEFNLRTRSASFDQYVILFD